MNRCNKCNIDFETTQHYCTKCGRNLSNNIEKTDVISFFSNLIIVVAIIGGYLIFIGFGIGNLFDSLNIGNEDANSSNNYIVILILAVVILLIVFGIYLKEKNKSLCLKNIKKIHND